MQRAQRPVDLPFHSGQNTKQGGTGYRRQNGGDSKSQDHLAIRKTAQQRDLEDVVRTVHHGSGADRHLDRVEQGENGQHQGTQPEARVHGQPGSQQRCQDYGEMCFHPIRQLPSLTMGLQKRLSRVVGAMPTSRFVVVKGTPGVLFRARHEHVHVGSA